MSFFNISKLGRSKSKKNQQKPLFVAQPFISATLVNGSLKKIVELPKYVDQNEWLAVNTFDFFNYINQFYGVIADFCTTKDCPIMSAGSNYEYTWTDNQKKNVKFAAPKYVDFVMTRIQNLLNDESVFPTKSAPGCEFPKDFINILRSIYKQLFRILAHIYWSHYDKILHLSCEGHLNTLFAHFICFAREFDLLDKKELAPMSDLIAELEYQIK